MYRGKFRKTVRRRKTAKKPGILILSLVLLLAVIVGGTIAYLQDATNQVVNTFNPAEVEIDPTEETEADEKSDIKFQNTGNVPVYIRATLTVYWKDSAGNLVAPPAGGSVTVNGVDVHSAEPKDLWSKVGNIYYYAPAVAPGSWTDVLLDPIVIVVPDGYTCHIDVHSEAIQADGMGATNALDAWTKAAQGSGS